MVKEKEMAVIYPEEIVLPILNGPAYWKPGMDIIGWTYKQSGHVLNKLLSLAMAGKSEKIQLDAIKEFLARPYPINQIIDVRPVNESPIDRLSDADARKHLQALLGDAKDTDRPKQEQPNNPDDDAHDHPD